MLVLIIMTVSSPLPAWKTLPRRRWLQVELLCRVSTLLLRLHMQQLMGTPSVRALLVELQQLLRQRVQEMKDVMGVNLAAMTRLRRGVRERQGVAVDPAAAAAAALLPLKRKAEAAAGVR